MKKVREIPAGRFKAECLGLLDYVAETGTTLIVTKRGQAVARLAPLEPEISPPLRGSVTFLGDVVQPIAEAWDVDT